MRDATDCSHTASMLRSVCPWLCRTTIATYRALQAPPAEVPVVNPDISLRQQNWLGPQREGSCAHASLFSLFNWTNHPEMKARWKTAYGGDGEYASRMRSRLDEQNIPYAFTERANLTLLDYAHSTRRGAILWWKPSHCCTFCGWVQLADGKTYAVILDNNSVGKYELTEKSQFHRAWASYGGFALCVLWDPPSPPLYRSYERVAETPFF